MRHKELQRNLSRHTLLGRKKTFGMQHEALQCILAMPVARAPLVRMSKDLAQGANGLGMYQKAFKCILSCQVPVRTQHSF
jgi:hypothetical protein